MLPSYEIPGVHGITHSPFSPTMWNNGPHDSGESAPLMSRACWYFQGLSQERIIGVPHSGHVADVS